jgi:hypothetical protein
MCSNCTSLSNSHRTSEDSGPSSDGATKASSETGRERFPAAAVSIEESICLLVA